MLFVSSGCVLCHGAQAEGFVGPRIARTVLALEDVRRQVRTPRTASMPSFGVRHITDDELARVYAFLQSLRPDQER